MRLGGPFVPLRGFIIPCPDCGGAFVPNGIRDTYLVTRTMQPRPEVLWRGVWLGTDWELDFKQCSFHHIMQVLRVCRFSTFSSASRFPPMLVSLSSLSETL